MTIQNIDDVMDRIMSLNRNLNEDSLKVLLSASGWDREDIAEGLRIFRVKNKNGVVATPIPNKVFDLDPNKIVETSKNNININNTDNNVSLNGNSVETKKVNNFNLLYKDNQSDNIPNSVSNNIPNPAQNKDSSNISPKPNSNNLENSYNFSLRKNYGDDSKTEYQDIVSSSIEKSKSENQINTNPYILKNNSKDNKVDENTTTIINQSKGIDMDNEVKTSTKQNLNIEHRSHRTAKVVFYILLLIVLGLLALYFFHPKFENLINQNLANNNNTNLNQNQPIKNNLIENNQPVISNDTSNKNDIEQLKNDVASLRQEFDSIKNTSSNNEPKTIVKYISQRGPSGRGILKAEATSSGFILTYTDGYKQIIPFATSTSFNNLNVEEICFRNMSTSTEMAYVTSTNTNQTMSSFDICLNKDQVLNILQN